MKIPFLKKMVLVMSMAVVTIFAYGQEKGDIAVGGNIGVGLDDFNNFGLTAKFQWNITDELRLEPSTGYYFENDNVDMWDMNINLHYLFKPTNLINLYPLAGFTILHADYGRSDTEFGVNLGGGIDFKLTNNFSIGAELKYQLVPDWNRFVLSAGVTYRF